MAESLIDKLREFDVFLKSEFCEAHSKGSAVSIRYSDDVILGLLERSTQSLIAVDDVLKLSEQGCWSMIKVSEIRKAIESTKRD